MKSIKKLQKIIKTKLLSAAFKLDFYKLKCKTFLVFSSKLRLVLAIIIEERRLSK